MPSWLIVALTAGAVIAIFLTTDAGKRLSGRLGVEMPGAGGPRRADREYLLRVCAGDGAAVEKLLADERRRFTDLSEAEIYRRAIRTHKNANPTDLEL